MQYTKVFDSVGVPRKLRDPHTLCVQLVNLAAAPPLRWLNIDPVALLQFAFGVSCSAGLAVSILGGWHFYLIATAQVSPTRTCILCDCALTSLCCRHRWSCRSTGRPGTADYTAVASSARTRRARFTATGSSCSASAASNCCPYCRAHSCRLETGDRRPRVLCPRSRLRLLGVGQLAKVPPLSKTSYKGLEMN